MMSDKTVKLSSNIAGVLFSDNSPFSIRLFFRQKNELQVSIAEKITLQCNEYYLAYLSLGENFYQQTILLKLFQQNDQTHQSIAQHYVAFNAKKNAPFLPLLTFDTEEHLKNSVFPPLFYCTFKDIFFHAQCETCFSPLTYNEVDDAIECKYCVKLSKNKKQFFIKNEKNNHVQEALLLSFGNIHGLDSKVPCSTCDNHSICFNSSSEKEPTRFEVFKYVQAISQYNFSLYAFEYIPLTLEDFFDFSGGKNSSTFGDELIKSAESKQLEFINNIIDGVLSLEDCTIASVLCNKLHVFSGLCDIALKLEALGMDADQYMKLENNRVNTDNGENNSSTTSHYPSLLPIFPVTENNKISERPGLFHIKKVINKKNNRNTVVEAILKNTTGDDSLPSLGDVIKVGFNHQLIFFIVKQKTQQTLLLETLKSLKNNLEQDFLMHYSQKNPKKIIYTIQNENNVNKAYKNLGKLYFHMLLSNSVLGEVEINHALKVLFLKIELLEKKPINESILNHMIYTTAALSVVFRQENCQFQPISGQNNLISDVDWLKLVLLGIKLIDSRLCGDLTEDSILISIKSTINDFLLKTSNANVLGISEEQDEASLIKSALSGIIEDNSWVETMLNKRRGATMNDFKNHDNSIVEKTRMYSKENKKLHDKDLLSKKDATVIMPNKNI